MTIPECITFTITKLVQILSNEIVFPFVGVYLTSYVIYLVIQLIRMKGRRL